MKLPAIARGVSLLVCSLPGLIQPAFGDLELRQGTLTHFSSPREGAQILGREDDFIARLSEFDRASRLKTAKQVSKDEFLQFVRANVLGWTDEERTRIEAAIADIRPALDAFPLRLPKTISLIKTTGLEEGNAFYTRDTALVFPAAALSSATTKVLAKTIAHELFHILSRQNPVLREALYQAIGFTSCAEVELPTDLRRRKITNPDAPRNDHSIRLQLDGQEIVAVPVLYSTSEKYDIARGGEFFTYLQFEFLVAKSREAGFTELVSPARVSGFFEQIGRNTDYVIHPEEILAENFAALVLAEPNVASPEILQRLRAILTKH